MEKIHKNEKIIKILNPSRWYYFWYYFLGIVLTIIGIFFPLVLPIGLITIIVTELIRRAYKFYITNQRLIYEFDFLSREIYSTTYKKIQDIYFTQGLIERLAKIGTIYINTAGTHSMEIIFFGIKNPLIIKSIIEKNILKKK